MLAIILQAVAGSALGKFGAAIGAGIAAIAAGIVYNEFSQVHDLKEI